MKVLLHVCCGPCAIYPLEWLRSAGHEVTGVFYNPNIHPFKEFARRFETAVQWAKSVELSLTLDDAYGLEEFITLVKDDMKMPKRCVLCYRIRLRNVAQQAKNGGYDAFSTSLLVSPYQQHELIREIAEEVAAETGVAFLYHDYREGWKRGVERSREMELYRQPYCGCIFSEQDRYYKGPGRLLAHV